MTTPDRPVSTRYLTRSVLLRLFAALLALAAGAAALVIAALLVRTVLG